MAVLREERLPVRSTATADRLPRRLGLWSAIFVAVGSTIGSGIFRVPSTVAADIGSLGGLALAWGLGAVVALFGALTLAELSAAGVGAVLVPFPFAVDDHQTANARALVDAGAALLVPDSEASPQRLAALLGELLGDRVRLLAMAQAARALAKPDAAARIADVCLEAAA